MDEFPGTVNEYGDYFSPYDRKIPETFVGDAAQEGLPPVDKFTQNLLKNYATEGKKDDKDPVPDGHYYISKEQGKKLAAEVACTHYKKCGDDATNWLDSDDQYSGISKYDAAWKYADVLSEGRIDAIGMSAFFLRKLFKPLDDHLDL